MENKTVIKPWGKYIILEKKPNFWIKKLFVCKDARLSLQSHKDREEVWVILSGAVEAVKDDAKIKLSIGEVLKINKNEKHRITGLEDAWILEVALGKVHEKDIVRLEDDYGRIK